MEGIVRPNGRPLMLSELIDEIDPIVGYMIEHQVTGRLLPTCNSFELYETVQDAILKMQEVSYHFGYDDNFNIFDYEIIDMRKSNLKEGGYIIINYLI